MTVTDIMTILGYSNATYDTAIPQPWADAMRNDMGVERHEPGHYVWLYDQQARISGRPFNYMTAYARHLLKLREQASEPAEDTFYDRWNRGDSQYTNLGGFTTKLMELYRHADASNRVILGTAFPDYFVNPINKP